MTLFQREVSENDMNTSSFRNTRFRRKLDRTVEDGNLVCPSDGGGFLFTEKQYGDFSFRFDFRLATGANNGIAIRSPLVDAKPAYEGMEIQILDHHGSRYEAEADTGNGKTRKLSWLKPWQYHGSVYGIVPAKVGYLKPVGQWNSEEITANGSRIVVKVNGQVIVDADIKEASKGGTMDGKQHPGLLNEQGYLGILGHGGGVDFRNMRIKELD